MTDASDPGNTPASPPVVAKPVSATQIPSNTSGNAVAALVVGGFGLVKGLFTLVCIGLVIFAVVEYHHAHTAEFKLKCAAHLDAGYPLSFPDNALCSIFY